MKKAITLLALIISLSATAQSQDTTSYVIKGTIEYYNAILENLLKLKSVLVFAESPYNKVEIIDKLIIDIKNQIEKQIKKPK